MKVIEGLYYSKDHEWIKVEGNKAFVGITDYAQHSLGSIVFVELPDTGITLSAGSSLGVVESVKAASDVYSPISGTVLASNNQIVDDPALLNEDAFQNWLIQMEVSDPSELEALMDAVAYQELVNKE